MSDLISMTKASFIAAITAEVQPLADRIRELEAQVAELEYRLRGAGIAVPTSETFDEQVPK